MSPLPGLISECSDFLGSVLEKAFSEAKIYWDHLSQFPGVPPPRPPMLQKPPGRTVGQVASGPIVAVEPEPVKTKEPFLSASLGGECLGPLLSNVILPHAEPGQPGTVSHPIIAVIAKRQPSRRLGFHLPVRADGCGAWKARFLQGRVLG